MTEISRLDIVLRLLQSACTLGGPTVTFLVYRHSQKKQEKQSEEPKASVTNSHRQHKQLSLRMPFLLFFFNIVVLILDVRRPVSTRAMFGIAWDVGGIFFAMNTGLLMILVEGYDKIFASLLKLQRDQLDIFRDMYEKLPPTSVDE